MTGNFLDSLTATERDAFTSVAEERTFARGVTLMREGDPADFVMVIIDGWTRITVQRGGRERDIAERGPGQLVGELGALRLNARSATVTALGTVRALAMKTESFASFLSAHPRVLALVQGQIGEQLASGPALAGENCTVVLTDIVGFGALQRTDGDRLTIRGASLDMMQESLGRLWEECVSEDQGDGLMVVAPPAIPTAKVMECLHRELPGRLRKHNRAHREPTRIRLRVAANVGPVVSDRVGISGEAIIRASRMLDAPALKDTMAAADASLGIIVSPFVYDTAIRHAGGWADPGRYKPVEVNVKESRIPAWIQLIDPSPPSRRFPLPRTG